MSTITDLFMTLMQDMRDQVAFLRGFRGEMLAIKDSSSGQITTIINNFSARPPVQDVFCDPLNGSEANDGLSPAKPKRSIDGIIANVGINAVRIVLLNDGVIEGRSICYGALSIAGAQRANNGRGWAYAQRELRFLGTATTSPGEGIGTFCSGIFLSGASFSTLYINPRLPVQPAGQTYPAHFWSGSGTTISVVTGTLLVDGTGAGQLIGVGGSRSTVYSDLTLGSGAAGHLFQSVAAGGNPNTLFAYSSNVTSA